MPPKEPETLDERMFRAEFEQERMERDFKEASGKIKEVEAIAMEALSVSNETKVLVEGMPDRVIKAIDERNRTRKLDVNSWISLICTVVMAATAVWALAQPHLKG